MLTVRPQEWTIANATPYFCPSQTENSVFQTFIFVPRDGK